MARLVAKRGTVNFVARRLEIDRRQFRKYLAGDALPQKATLAKIARYFQVPIEYLFTEIRERPGAPLDDACLQVLTRAQEQPPGIAVGLYHTWFWSPEHRETALGALTAVRSDKGGMTFRRLTASAARRGTRFSFLKGDHQGIVSERMGWIYFQGSNRLSPQEPTLLALNRAVSARWMLAGHGMVLTQNGPSFVNVVMDPADPSMSLRAALQMARAVPLIGDIINPQVALLLQRPLQSLDPA